MTPSFVSYEHPLDVINFLLAARDGGEKMALLAVTHTEGGSVRAVGALVGVSENGAIAGYISNGCVDQALVHHAVTAIASGQGCQIRFGAESPYRDLQLPCGGAIDLRIIPNPCCDILAACAAKLTARQALVLHISADDQLSLRKAGDKLPDQDGEHIIPLQPKWRLRIAGVGAEMAALTKQAIAAGFEVIAQSPNAEFLAHAQDIGAVQADLLTTPDRVPVNADDRWTGFVMLFHDHDWELELLKAGLAGEAFYIGAMGSCKTHDIRRQRLLEAGVAPESIDRIHGPIGLIPSLKQASFVALSCLAEVIDCTSDLLH